MKDFENTIKKTRESLERSEVCLQKAMTIIDHEINRLNSSKRKFEELEEDEEDEADEDE